MQTSITPPRYGAVGAALGKAFFWYRKLKHEDRYDDFVIERVHGTPIIVMPSVFNPRVLRTGEFFAQQITAHLIAANAEVLDMGTGSGICAVVAAKYAQRVVAVDINASAVRCARVNALMNQVEHKIDVRHGDLFTPVAAERFDVILFNPPFIRDTPVDERDCAWRSTDAAERFAAQLKNHLEPGGFALVLLSTFGDAPTFLPEFHKHDLVLSVHAQREFLNETLTIFRVSHGTLSMQP